VERRGRGLRSSFNQTGKRSKTSRLEKRQWKHHLRRILSSHTERKEKKGRRKKKDGGKILVERSGGGPA